MSMLYVCSLEIAIFPWQKMTPQRDSSFTRGVKVGAAFYNNISEQYILEILCGIKDQKNEWQASLSLLPRDVCVRHISYSMLLDTVIYRKEAYTNCTMENTSVISHDTCLHSYSSF